MISIRVLAVAFIPMLSASVSSLAYAQTMTIKNFHTVEESAIYRSGKPKPEQISELKALGVRTIVSLETYMLDPDDAAEEEAAAQASGIEFKRVPMSPLLFEPPTVEQIQAAVDLIANPALQPVLVHCYRGSDRTGLVVGAYHIEQDGWTADEAIADMRNYGHSVLFYSWDPILYRF